MSGAGTPAVQTAGAPRGRIDKRRAIVDAAFTVFAREGYAQAGVDVIAAEAGVAKATVYNHFGDKETLLRQTIADHSDRALARNMAAVERLTGDGPDLRAMLEEVGGQLLRCYVDDASWALRRLLSAEIGQFPDLIDIVQGRAADRVLQALADRLGRLSLAGRLRTADPLLAAEHLSALLTGTMDTRARLGTRPLPDAELTAMTRAAVDTFLRAFAAEPVAPGPPPD
ncbi:MULTISPECIES: TetR/AcrR family transcriptional regulator [Thermomonosporaceae]|uniref:TetR/AcrR family transcriptional regulator n=1 Tax=Thermomonosporaceae TaxID=2012 RepID=UPI00255A8BC6|nr:MULTISPECIES: TetR/AcrR family transcriptional regulator [Thermomonosporaceae]MDL4776952.1 TetR/AcrR family transcriptional regulator [Actinomadura xylanilytica]